MPTVQTEPTVRSHARGHHLRIVTVDGMIVTFGMDGRVDIRDVPPEPASPVHREAAESLLQRLAKLFVEAFALAGASLHPTVVHWPDDWS